jgi:hypothetical protein
MDKRLLCTTAIVLGLGSYAFNELGNAITPTDTPEELPSTPSRITLLVSNVGSTSLSGSASASATQVPLGNLWITNMVTGDIYDWMKRDPKERPVEIFDVRSWPGMATGERPTLVLDVGSGSTFGMATEQRPGWPFAFGKTNVRST